MYPYLSFGPSVRPSVYPSVRLSVRLFVCKKLNLVHISWTVKDSSHFSTVHTSWLDLLFHTVIFDLVTLSLEYDLFTKTFNLGHISWTIRDRFFLVFFNIIPNDYTIHLIPWPLTLWPYPWSLTFFTYWTITWRGHSCSMNTFCFSLYISITLLLMFIVCPKFWNLFTYLPGIISLSEVRTFFCKIKKYSLEHS